MYTPVPVPFKSIDVAMKTGTPRYSVQRMTNYRLVASIGLEVENDRK